MILSLNRPEQIGMILVVALLLAACTSTPTPDTVQPTTAPPESTSLPTATQLSVTDTPAPTQLPAEPRPTISGTVTPVQIALPPMPSGIAASNDGLPSGAIRRIGEGGTRGMVVSPLGTLIMRIRSDRFEMLDAETFDVLWTHFITSQLDPVRIDYGQVDLARFSPDGRKLATSINNELFVWDSASGDLLHSISVSDDEISSYDWSPDGTQIVVGTTTYRDFDWFGDIFVWNMNSDARTTLPYADLPDVYQVEWSPLGGLIAAASGYKSVRTFQVWETGTYETLYTIGTGFDSVPGPVGVFSFSPDGQTIVFTEGVPDGSDAVNVNNRIHLIDTLTGAFISTIEFPGTDIVRMWQTVISPSGRWLAPSNFSDADTFPIWDISSGEIVRELTLPPSVEISWYVANVKWSPNDERLTAVMSAYNGSGYENVVVVWELATGEPQIITNQVSGIRELQWLQDSTGLLIDGDLWDVPSRQRLHSETRQYIGAPTAWLPDTGQLIYRNADGLIVADAATFDPVSTIPVTPARSLTINHDGSLAVIETGISLSPEGEFVENQLILWDFASRTRTTIPSPFVESVTYLPRSLAFAPDGQRLAVNALTSAVYIIDVSSTDILDTIRPDVPLAASLVWLDDNTLIAPSEEGAALNFLNVQTQEIDTVRVSLSSTMLALSPDSSKIALAGYEPSIAVLDLTTYEMLFDYRIETHVSRPLSVAMTWTPDSHYVFLSVGGGTGGHQTSVSATANEHAILMWDVTTGELVHSFVGHASPATDLAVSPHGTILASASLDGTVILWDLTTIIP